MIFISTGGSRNQTAIQTALDFYAEGIRHVELSGGLCSPQIEEDLKTLPSDLLVQIHNYFPPPITPFVFNLASDKESVASVSFGHALQAIKIAANLKRRKYSFHAGFRMNPGVNELGRRIIARKLIDRGVAINNFIDQVQILSRQARLSNVDLLIENNVITRSNFDSFGEDPLLMTHPDEIIAIMSKVPKNVGLLLDVAHLYVSSKTLNFDVVEAHEKIKPWIKGYHLSENDGIVDSNQPIKNDSWFWRCLVRNLDYYTLEVYGTAPQEMYSQYCLAADLLARENF